MNNQSKLFANDQPLQQLDPQLQQKVRIQAFLRQPTYTHPSLQIQHQPINAKQCIDLQRQLKGQVINKIDQIKNREADMLAHEHVLNYDQHYSDLMGKDMYNQGRVKGAYEDIRQMHNMADMLMEANNIWNSGQLYLYQRNKTYEYNRDKQFEQVYKKYRDAYQAQQKVDDGMAEDAIKRAKRFLLKDYE